MIVSVMGEFADMALEQCGWGYDEDYQAGLDIPFHERKPLQCSSCKQTGLSWRKVNGRWIMVENTGGVHSCQGYSPPLDALKVIAKEVAAESYVESLWKLQDQLKERGSISKIANVIPDGQLIDLLICFIRDDQREHDDPVMGPPITFKCEIELLKAEILKRINKK